MIRLGFLSVIVFFSCSSKQSKTDEARDSVPLSSDTSFALTNFEEVEDSWVLPPDSLFPLKNSKSTSEIDSQNLKLTYLDSLQVLKIIASCPGLNHRAYWIVRDWQVAFVSKQNLIGDHTPIIVSVGGTDYAALILILLSKQGNPVSHFVLRGGECDGSILCDLSNSTIDNDKIEGYRVKYASNPDNNLFITVDSITYSSAILQNGKIETVKKDSLRFRRKFL